MEYFGYGSNKKESPTSARKKWGNAQVAATLRISESMTIRQLQEECKLRGIRNYSGLNKNALLDLLGVGTIWMSVSMSKMNQNSHTQQNEAKSYTTDG